MAVTSKCRDRENRGMIGKAGKYLTVLACLVSLWGCSLLPRAEPEALDTYVLEYNTVQSPAAGPDQEAPVMLISRPRAHAGYDTPRMAYLNQPHGLRYFTRSRWADTPVNMLAPLLADALTGSGCRVLYAAPGSIAASLRLDTELLRFHQDFTRQPSVMQLSLRATLVDLRDNRVLASRRYDITEPATSEDAYGGVQAANRAVSSLIAQLASFCDAGSR